jgi:methionine-rich copper-binding protein CopC
VIARGAAALLVGLLVALGAGTVGASPAVAHASEVGSSPEAGAILDAPPQTVAVEFDSPILDIGAAIVVRAADGASVVLGTPRIERQQISVDVDPAAAPGQYTVAYRVVAEDGHTIESTFDYTVAGTTSSTGLPTPASSSASSAASSAAPSAASTAAPSTTPVAAAAETGSSPPYLLLGAGALVVILAAAGALALRR